MSETLKIRTCHFGSCLTMISGVKIFCDYHWSRIPSPIQHEIANAWRKDQRVLRAGLNKAGRAITEREKKALVS